MRVFERAALLPLLAVLSLVAPATVLGGDDVPPEVTAKSASGLLPVAIDLGRARRFNGFFLEHFSAPSSDTEGALAAGGDVALDSYSVGERLHAGFTGPSLIAGGDLVFPSGRVYRGDIVVGGSAAGVGAPVIEGLGADQSLAEYAELPFDFALQGIRLRATSQHLATLTANGSFEWQWGGLHLQGDCESAWQVFELNGAQVLEAHTFEVDCIPAGATVIFNIDGSEAGLTNMSLESLAAHRQRVLFNFHQAQTLTLAGIAVQGSILAPHAHVANPQGVVHGSVMAKSWHGSMQLNHVPFRAVGEGDICGLYPIALPHELLIDAEPGTVFEQMPRGTGPGNFNWLTWTGHPSAPTLAQSLIPPGDSHTYINPDDPDDFLLSVGDWAQGSPGTVNSAAVRANLDALLNTEIAVPAFDARRNQGNNFDYRVASFARIRLIDYRLTGQGWLSFEFVGFTRCYNRAPIAHDQQLETPRDTPLPIELTGTDYDGDELSFEILTQPAHGSLEGEGAHWTYTPAPGYVGPDQFTFRVSDGEADSAPVTVSITVFQTNQPPIAHDQQLEVLQGESLDIELTGEDPDGDPLSFRIIEAPQHGSLNGESPSLVYTPNPDFHGEDSFSFVAHDGEIDSEPAVVRIRVLRVNLPPQIISQAPFTVEEDALYRYPAEAVDPNVGDVLTWSLDARPVGMEVGAASGVAEWVGDASLVGGVELQNRMCRRGRLPGVFDPEVKWHWKREPGGGTDRNVYGPVTVAQMNDDNGDGVIDHRDIPDAVFMSSGGLLNIVSGADGSQILASSGHGLSTLGSLALADLTGDGYVEIVGVSSAQRTELIAVRHDGTELWRVPTSGPTVTGSNGIPRDALTIADLDGDGTPEIIHGRRVYNADGSLRWVGTGDHGGNRGYALIPSVADVTGDGFQEVIAGRTVYRHDGTILWHVPTTADGYTGVANFDDDPYPEIVLVAGGRVHLIDHDGTLLWRSGTLPGGGHGGPPTIADMDGDGIPEIGVAGSSRYVVFNADGSIKWSMPVQDHSSHQTGSSVFDFEGDGRAEVVYADEVHLFVFDGATGAVRLKMPIGSGTTLEYPTIVDIDGNGSANILVGGNAVNGRRGVFAIGSATDSWAPTRKIWNQHAYHIDNINDDGSVPLHPTKGWLTHNSFRLNTFPDREALALPDLALFDLRLASAEHGPVLRVRVRNRGLAPVEEDTEVVFHSGNLSGPWNLVGRVAVPPLSADVAIEIDLPLDSVTGLGDYLRAEIDPEGLVGECIEANNITFARLAQIRVTDPGGLFDTQIFSIAVSDRNDPPTLHTESLPHGAPESAWQAQLYATDPDIGDALQYGLVAAPEGMHIDEVSGQLVWTPLASQSGDHLVTVQVSDLAGAVVERSYQVRIADNHPPEFVSEPVTVAEVGQPYSYAAYAIDPEGDPVSYSLVTAPTGMSVDDTTGVVSWMPQLAQIGVHTVALRAEDRLGAGTTQQFEIDVVGPLNRPPVITSTPSTTAFAGQLYQYLVEAEDPDGDVLSVLLPEAPAGMVLNEFSGLLSWVPEEGQVGTHAVRVEVIDGRGGVAVQTWDLVVQAPDPDNQPPSIDSTPGFTATVGLEYIYQVVASDPDGDALSYSLIDGPAGMSMDAVSGRLNFTPSLAQVGTHAVAVRVDDGRGGYAVQNYTLTVLDGSGGTNHPPSIVSTPPGSVVLGSSYTYQVEAVDPDGDSLIHVLRQAPAGMSLGHASGLLTWTPLPEQVGQHDVVLEVSDGRGGVASQSFVVQVQDDGGGGTNRPPTIVSQPPTQAKVGREYRYAVDAFDADGDALNYSVPAGPDGMSVDADGVLTWTPADAGSVAASVRVDDGQAWVQQHWTIQVAAADVELGADVLISPQPVAPGESLVITIIVEGAAGAVTIEASIDGTPIEVGADGTAVVTAPETPGNHTVEVEVSDGHDTITVIETFIVLDPDSATPPRVELHTPDYEEVLTAPTAIVASIADDDLVAWKLAYRDRNDRDADFVTLAEGSEAFDNAVIATFDPTLLLNGQYVIALQAWDAGGNTAFDSRVVTVDGEMKLGHFAISFEEVSIPVAGIPVTVTRSYDT
ncbi:MAG TPA: Ig-like domain-containing protein, partial [Xanthomonadaceae bacterium]|nr:Ig-like domain-containing protein [Xanthomonadaceae bacterium]